MPAHYWEVFDECLLNPSFSPLSLPSRPLFFSRVIFFTFICRFYQCETNRFQVQSFSLAFVRAAQLKEPDARCVKAHWQNKIYKWRSKHCNNAHLLSCMSLAHSSFAYFTGWPLTCYPGLNLKHLIFGSIKEISVVVSYTFPAFHFW